VSRVPRLALLAPDIVEAILDDRPRAKLQLNDLLEGFPLEWDSQPFGKRRG
jgi:hypothetical protein